MVDELPDVRMGHEEQRDDQKFANTNRNMTRSHTRKLPVVVIATSATAAIGTATYLDDAEVAEREADPDELGDDREEVQDEQVADREPSPEPAEPLVDQSRVSDAGDARRAGRPSPG